jgi:hypothetical protein
MAPRRSQRNSSHDHLQVRQSGRTRSGVAPSNLPETSPKDGHAPAMRGAALSTD